MLKLTTTSNHLKAAIRFAERGFLVLEDGDDVFSITWNPYLCSFTYEQIPDSKTRKVILTAKDVYVCNSKTAEPIITPIVRKNGCLMASEKDENGKQGAPLPVLELVCKTDNWIALPFFDDE